MVLTCNRRLAVSADFLSLKKSDETPILLRRLSGSFQLTKTIDSKFCFFSVDWDARWNDGAPE